MKFKSATLESLLLKLRSKKELQNRIKNPETLEQAYYKYNPFRNVYQVRINKSVVFARIYVDLQAPYPDSDAGKLRTTFNFSQCIEPNKELWIPNMQALECGRVVERGLRANVVKLDKLKVTQDLVWSISIELHCFSIDGNIIDCSFLAAYLALKNTKLPFEKYDLMHEDITWINSDCYNKTLYIFENNIVENLDVYEVACCETGISFCISDSRIVAIQKLKGGPISKQQLKNMTNLIFEKYEKKWNLVEAQNIWSGISSDVKTIK